MRVFNLAEELEKERKKNKELEAELKLYKDNHRYLNNIIDELEKELDLNLQFKVIGVRRLKDKLKELKENK